MKSKEKKIRNYIFSKVFSESAAVYLEFALSFPLLLGFSLFILEMLMFWDASVMANHAAFTISRIAKVHYYHGSNKNEDNPYPAVEMGGIDIPADKAILSFFMMPCTFSWFGPPQKKLQVDFYDYFKITKPLYDIKFDSDIPDFFQKVIVDLLKLILNPIDDIIRGFINNEINLILNKIFGSSSSQMNIRYNMALQRAMIPGTIDTKLVSLEESVKFPSDDYLSGVCEFPEIAKVSISYPLFKGGWLYSFFMFWKTDNDKNLDAVRVSSRWSFFAEPERDIEYYFAFDDGSSDIDPDDLKKRARERAKKIIDETSTIIDEWERAVIARENIGNQYGEDAPHHSDYKDACKNEAHLWSEITQKIHDFMKIIESKPKKGGLCGDKKDSAGPFCHTNPTAFTKCARNEMQNNLPYCERVVSRIREVANNHHIWKGDKIKIGKKVIFKGYVSKDKPGIVYPGHEHHDLFGVKCSTQYFCPDDN